MVVALELEALLAVRAIKAVEQVVSPRPLLYLFAAERAFITVGIFGSCVPTFNCLWNCQISNLLAFFVNNTLI